MESYTENKKARFNYEILDTYEAGIELKGFEVKAIKSGRMNLAGAFVVPRGANLWLLNASISPYQPKNTPEGYDELRSRKLLLHKKEIDELFGKSKSGRLTIIPLKAYPKRGFVKIEIGLARSKNQGDKRETIRERETEREMRRSLK